MTPQEKISRILEEERRTPTVLYSPVKKDQFVPGLNEIVGRLTLRDEYKQTLRVIHDYPEHTHFSSTNYDLLLAILAQLDESSLQGAFALMLARLANPNACIVQSFVGHPHWGKFTSEAPLIVELCIRRQQRAGLMRMLSEAPLAPPLVLALFQLEEVLAFNWNVVPPSSLDQFSQVMASLQQRASQSCDDTRKVRFGNGETYLSSVALEARRIAARVRELCRKASYLYIKTELLEGLNLEVNQDKLAVASSLRRLGFSENLVLSLDHAEELLRSTSPFDLKSSLGHLRSFLENLHIDVARRIKTSAMTTPTSWGASVLYLRQNGILTIAEESVVTSVYTLISDGAVHPLIAEKEYARLAKNMVIECGLLVLNKAEKNGLR